MQKKIKQFLADYFPEISRKIYHTLNRTIYRGNKYYCPVCEKNYISFFPAGDNTAGNSKCPGCSSLERQRLLWLFLEKQLLIKSRRFRLLNVAPDRAIQNKLKSLDNIDYISIDLSSGIAMQNQDLTKLGFADNSFDLVLCYHVLEHIVDDRKAMKELYRVTKPGGLAIIQTPVEYDREKTFEDLNITTPDARRKLFGQEDHVRIYGNDYFERLRLVGFDVVKNYFVNTFMPGEIEKYVLDKDEILCCCRKIENLNHTMK